VRRELAILFGVLGPFALLVALGFAYTSKAPEPLSTPVNEPPLPVRTGEGVAPVGRQPTAVALSVQPTEARALPVEARDAGGAVVDAGLPDEPLPPELAAPIGAITPEFTRCFDDQRSRAQAPVDVTLRFRPTRDGGFADTELTSTWQDPYLTACLTDVLDEVGWVPTGRETFERATHVFHFHAGLRAPPKAH
jgi:hypothetical protein